MKFSFIPDHVAKLYELAKETCSSDVKQEAYLNILQPI